MSLQLKPQVVIGGSHLSTVGSKPGAKPYTVYEVSVTRDGRVYHLERRYSQFHKLNERLGKTYGSAAREIGKLFPGKMYSYNLSPARVDQRHMKICTWMTAVLADPQLSVCPELNEFLSEDQTASSGPQIVERMRASTATWASSSHLQSIGTLFKHKRGKWLLRYFILRGNVLYKYTSPTSKNPMSQHTLDDDLGVRVIPRELRLEAPYEYQFTLSVGGKEHLYAAPSEGEFAEWIHNLSRGRVKVPWIGAKTVQADEDDYEDDYQDEDDDREDAEEKVDTASKTSAKTTPLTVKSDAKADNDDQSRTAASASAGRSAAKKSKQHKREASKPSSRRALFASMPNRESYRRFLEPLLQQLQRNAPVVDLLFGSDDYNVSMAVQARGELEEAYARDQNVLNMSRIQPPTLSGLLLLYLYQMPRPLIPAQLFYCFMGVHPIATPEHKVTVLRKLIFSLPKYSAKVLDGLLYFMHRVEINHGGLAAAPSDVPSVWTQNLAHVLGPLVMRPPTDQHGAMWKSAEEHSSLLLEFAACRYTQLFCESPEEELSAVQTEVRAVQAEQKQEQEQEQPASTQSSTKKQSKKASRLAGTVRENYALSAKEATRKPFDSLPFRRKYSMLVKAETSEIPSS